MMRPLVIGNWKMHGSQASVESLLRELARPGEQLPADVVVCPSFVHLQQAIGLCEGSPVEVGAQDCSAQDSGARTGDVSAAMLADLGCRWVIVGHSERRQYHAEGDELIAAKITAAISAGLNVVVCVGETRAEREAGDAHAVVAGQVRGALAGQASLGGIAVAYEPIWAIGTGLTATPDQAQQMHAFIRAQLPGQKGVETNRVPLLYGGSVKPDNAAALFGQPDIDGALVGGASLDAGDFRHIIMAAE
ncbi:triose-phosphate isomerase [Kineobactrum sediminis]|uniref:Triosephosphate isomerase n=1 Tax=Kineobactrum sediminis TaxID=1905677 RepID=A0A2N5Y6C4_9GAMM|nr:triose-phosphate isomerase [Kineobactrum sediminis]PLW83922.1 triose-phosphate isomerase [Kineobactrum sediminis]